VIQGYAEMLSRSLPAEGQAVGPLEAIVDATNKASELTSSLLAFGRKQVVRSRVVDLNALLRDSTGMIRRIVDENVVIETELDPELRNVEVDPGQINQVLLNLAANARDAMPDGGTLRISTANVSVLPEAAASLADAPAVVELGVADTGGGMSEETRTRIFEPFFTTKDVAEGTGLGLASVYGIIEGIGGVIDVASALGDGTCFRIFLRATDAPLADVAPPPASPELRQEGVRVLVVEDQEMLLRMMRQILERAGHEVVAVGSGSAAIDAFNSCAAPFDVVITDVTMPGMSGTHLIDRLRECSCNLRVLYVSGYSADQLGDRLNREALSDFLAKPFHADDLLAAVQELIQR
jgi:CheY-like chemotaxis protein